MKFLEEIKEGLQIITLAAYALFALVFAFFFAIILATALLK